MSDTDLAFTSAWRLAQLIRTKKLSPVELVQCLIRRIEALNPRLNAYLTVAFDQALADARSAEVRVASGGELLPLLGVPVSIKDLAYVKGLPATGGSLAYKDFVPTEDAVVVERLRRAGAIILGKTNTPEFGLSATTENRLGEDCRNPWDTDRTSGGSSGGAAASVAAGMGPLALGSDGGGSVRVPASFCGVFGLKPTYGLIPAHGGFSCMPLFSHLGPITRTVRDAALFLSVTAGYDVRDPRSRRDPPSDFQRGLARPFGKLRIAWSPDLNYASADQEVVESLGAAVGVFETLGCVVEPATPDIQQPFADAFGPILQADAYAAQGYLLEGKASLLSETTLRTLERGRDLSGHAYSRAMRAVEEMRAKIEGFFEDYDLLLTPATAVPAFVGGQHPRVIGGVQLGGLWGAFPFSVPFNISRQPAASVPCGFSKEGLPIGLQIVGRAGEDRLVLRASAAFETARPWAGKRPPMAA